ncbi:glycoside hydrolase domain-containing protein [Streptomyces tendae]|uniref:glycoside hydrolase domain-containing protein n=1 Tax=Streptomyces tendae TaxID=1932 RepID=UPI003681FFF6
MADDKVLAAQRWANATYSGVAGYVRCAEDGITGWGTMNALTMGLQHELGISPVVASFGPTTLSRLEALGPLHVSWAQNANIARILKHALFCKGYWGGNYDTGEIEPATGDAVDEMKSHMGLPTDTTVQARIFKCILNLDAYVRTPGGSDAVRQVQQWLNGHYWLKDAYVVGPCDGHYSRDVQKALMIALQYEIGVPVPNGNFGDGTKAGLRGNPVGQGDSGVIPRLFSAACVFNSPLPGGSTAGFTDTYDAELAAWVREFQDFSLLERGEGDYGTWCQLLVSMGDASRPVTGSDTRFEITPARARWLTDRNYEVVGRYLYDPPGSTLDKEIKPGELDTIFAAGLKVFPIFQANARTLGDFTTTQGYEHGALAHDLAREYGFNWGTVIYFAVDYDATQAEIDSAIVPYFQGVATALKQRGGRYRLGVYGSRNVCANVTERAGAKYSFVSGMSWGFSGNLGYPLPANWAFNQIQEIAVTNGTDTFDLDRDAVSGRDRASASVNQPAAQYDGFIAAIEDLYGLAVQYGKGNPDQLVMEFVRHDAYGGPDWVYLIGNLDKDFVAYAEARGMTVPKQFVDPFTGAHLGAEHLLATANGVLVHPPEENRRGVNGGDVAGWGGDLITLYADWRDALGTYPDGRDFVNAKMANPDAQTTFGQSDFIEDVDGYLIAQACRSRDIVTAIREHYESGGGARRFTSFWNSRFTGNADDAGFAASNILTTSESPVDVARTGLLLLRGTVVQPAMLPYSELERFWLGFLDVLRSRVNGES